MSKNTPQAESPPDVEIVKPKHDADGNKWTSEISAVGTRVYLMTKEGRALNVLAVDEAAGRKTLLAFLAAE